MQLLEVFVYVLSASIQVDSKERFEAFEDSSWGEL